MCLHLPMSAGMHVQASSLGAASFSSTCESERRTWSYGKQTETSGQPRPAPVTQHAGHHVKHVTSWHEPRHLDSFMHGRPPHATRAFLHRLDMLRDMRGCLDKNAMLFGHVSPSVHTQTLSAGNTNHPSRCFMRRAPCLMKYSHEMYDMR